MPGPKKLMNDHKRKRKAALMLARGATKAEVGRAVGVSRPTVSRWANQDEARAWIEDETQKYLESLPDALAISKNLLRAGKEESGKLLGKKGAVVDHKVLEMATREAESMRKSVGITPTHQQSIIIGQLICGDQKNVLAPNVQSLLDRQLAEVLDVTPETEGEESGECS